MLALVKSYDRLFTRTEMFWNLTVFMTKIRQLTAVSVVVVMLVKQSAIY